MAHANARLTEFGRRLLVQRITELAGPQPGQPRAWGCRGPPPTSGWVATGPKAQPGWPIDPLGPTTVLMPCPPPSCVGCWPLGGAAAGALTDSATTWGCLAPPSMGCCAAIT